MKMKKLLSMGAIGLVLACSTSIGASAATIPTELLTKDSLLKIITNQYNNGTNTFGILSGVNKDTTIGNAVLGDVVGIDVTAESASSFINLSSHPTANKIVTKIVNNKDNTIATVLGKAIKDQDTFTKFQNDFVTVLGNIQEMKGLEGTARVNAEKKVMFIVNLYDNSLNVTFGKDSTGKTTTSIEQNGRVLVQLNSDNIQTITDIVSGLSLADVTNAIK